MPTVVRVIVYEYDTDEIMRKDMTHWQLPQNGSLKDLRGLNLVGKRITSFLADRDGGKHTVATRAGRISVSVVKEELPTIPEDSIAHCECGASMYYRIGEDIIKSCPSCGKPYPFKES